MKLVKVEDLNVGDNIIVSSNTKLKFMTVLKKPVIGTPRRWRPNDVNWKSVKCSTKVKITVLTYGSGTYTRTRNLKEYVPTFEDHDVNMYANLNYKNILLIEKDDNYAYNKN